MKKLYKTKHGLSGTRLYRIWGAMRNRCSSSNNVHFRNYGGRGIDICTEWKNDFIIFRDWSLDHGYKDNLSIDRIDNDKGYSPNNCRFVTTSAQSRNKRLTIQYKGECAADASKRLGGSENLVAKRIKYGWSYEKAFNTPSRARLVS